MNKEYRFSFTEVQLKINKLTENKKTVIAIVVNVIGRVAVTCLN